MLLYLILLLTIVPFVELVILLQVHHAVSTAFGPGAGLLATLGTVIVTGIIGAALARQQGLSVLKNLQLSLNRGELPGATLADGVLILIGAALLLTPGFLTDLFGFSLLIPVTRMAYRKLLIKWAKQKMARGQMDVRVSGFRETPSPTHSENAHYEPNLSEEEDHRLEE
ncbi:MAG: FxsA family protein [Planctomycetaceae bacterium]|nr:FxsA family protein [Planctomycetaceae bacterium]